MISIAEAQLFAREWVEAWNSHNLEAIMAHYDEAVESISPFAAKSLGDPSGKVKGKSNLRAYFRKALAAFPDLKFEIFNIFKGVSSLVIYYRSVKGLLAAEVFVLNDRGKVIKVLAHYDAD
jgi:hypothetical protein